MGIVSMAAIIIFGAIGLAVVLTIVVLLLHALQGDSDRRRIEKARRTRDHHESD